MLKTETAEISCWYDFESVRALSVRCDCGLPISDDMLERLTDESMYVCPCGKATKLAELDALADSIEQSIPKTTASKS